MDINRIAEMAGVSRATVSRYLNDGYVSQEKRKAISRVIEKTGYVPSQHAQTLRTGKTRLVGVIIPKINSASVSRMVAGITQVFNDKGYRVLLANTDNDPSREVEFLRLFSEQNSVDGIILIATVFTTEHLSLLEEIHLPLVVLDQQLQDRYCVFQDDYGAIFHLTKKLLQTGKNLAFIGVTQEDISAGQMRRDAFLDACLQEGISVPESALATADFSIEAGYRCAEEIFKKHPKTDSVICATDSIACGVLTYLHEHKKIVPTEVQVTGVGDGEISQIVVPSLTTIHHHYKTSGIKAAEMLADLMAAKDPAQDQIKVAFEIVERRSTR